METIVFDVSGNFAHFRAYDTTRENISYPFPSRTVILGLTGAVLGLERNEYWSNEDYKNSMVSIRILNPIWRSKMLVNYLQTKTTLSLPNRLRIIMPGDPLGVKTSDSRGFNAQIFLNILRNVKFRVYFYCKDLQIMEDLEERLTNNKYCYPPYLGHANMLAEIHFIGNYKSIRQDSGIHEVHSIISTEAVGDDIDTDIFGFTIIYNIPHTLKYENSLISLEKTVNIIFKETDIEDGIKLSFKNNRVFKYQINDKEENIVFL